MKEGFSPGVESHGEGERLEAIRKPEPLTPRDRDLLASYAGRPLQEMDEGELAMYELLVKLQDQLHRDELTGLPNRRFYLDRIEQEKQIPRERAGARTFFFIDVNNFKSYNELYTYDGADKILQQVAEHIGSLIDSSVRADDFAFRYAGDEFCVIAHTDEAGALHIAERIHDLIASTPVEVAGEHVYVAVSIGYTTDASDLDAARKHASQALLYGAKAKKESGERTIARYEDMVPTEETV